MIVVFILDSSLIGILITHKFSINLLLYFSILQEQVPCSSDLIHLPKPTNISFDKKSQFLLLTVCTYGHEMIIMLLLLF